MKNLNLNLKNLSDKDLRNNKNAMSNMFTFLKSWGIKDVKMIDLNPEIEVKEEETKQVSSKEEKTKQESSKEEKTKQESSKEEKTKQESSKEEKQNKKENKEKPKKHIGYWMIQGKHRSSSNQEFNFQIVTEHGVLKENGQQQYKLILQYKKDQAIETYPQTNPDLKALIMNYIYKTNPQPFILIEEDKKEEKKATK